MRLRDPLASDAALLFSQFFSRLSNEKDREMLRDCFVETGESRKADFELEKIIQRVLNTITPIETGHGNALQAELERAMNTRRSETVLLIGNKGAGKSTFIDRFFQQVLPLRLREKCVVAAVDLEDYHGDPILDWASRGHQKLPCLIFDNTDQFSPEIQDMVYQGAHSLESAAPVFNIVPITDRTVWRLSKAGALQSYSAHSFYLPTPDAKEIISRRMEFLKSKVHAEPKAAQSYFSNLGFRWRSMILRF
jgi:hypothetical protein